MGHLTELRASVIVIVMCSALGCKPAPGETTDGTGATSSEGTTSSTSGTSTTDSEQTGSSTTSADVECIEFPGGTNFCSQNVNTGLVGYKLASADFNGDQKQDLAAWNGLVLSVSYGDGNGGFGPPMTMPAKSNGLTMDLAAGDLDNDGISEVFLFDGSMGRVTVCQALDGTVADVAILDLEDQTLSIRVVDINADGLVDLVAGILVVNDTESLGGVRTYIGSPQGFTKTEEIALLPHCYASAITPVHLNPDGLPDLVALGGCAANLDQTPFSLLMASGGGTYEDFGELVAGEDPQWVATARINGDSELDIIVMNQASNDFSVYIHAGDGQYEPEKRQALDCESCTNLLYVDGADLDGDQIDEILFIVGSKSGSVLRAQHMLDWEVELSTAWSEFSVADFNEDGQDDIAFPYSVDGQVHILLSSGK